MSLTKNYANGSTRAFAGAIVTFVNTDTGELRVEHRGGYVIESRRLYERRTETFGLMEVLRSLCADADGWDGNWKVRCISTPMSILSDLRVRATALDDSSVNVSSYEATMLSKIGRIDMWEGTYAKSHMERRRRANARLQGGAGWAVPE